MGLNDILENTLSSLSAENSLSSWSIYHEANGYISVKIRFKADIAVSNSVNREPQVHFKKKPIKQVQRDRARSQAWHADRQAAKCSHQQQQQQQKSDICEDTGKCTADSPRVTSAQDIGVRTRSMILAAEGVTPEVTRCDLESTPNTGQLLDPTALPFQMNCSPRDISLLYARCSDISQCEMSNNLENPALDGSVLVLEGDVSVLEGDVSMLEGDVSVLEGDVSVLGVDVSSGDIDPDPGDTCTDIPAEGDAKEPDRAEVPRLSRCLNCILIQAFKSNTKCPDHD